MGNFLYGHVAKEGETPTHTIAGVDYVGAILPALPEKTSDNISLRIVRRVVRDTAFLKFDGYYHTSIYAGCTCSVDSNGNLVITANGVGSNTLYPGKMQPVSDTLRSGAVEWSVSNSGSWIGTYSFPLDELIWTADTIYDTSTGELIMSASDPIPVGSAPEVEPKSFMAGWRMGQIVRAMRMNSPGITPPEEEKTPVAYSYNGVEMPDIYSVLTDEQKAQHQYAMISSLDVGEILEDESLHGEILYYILFLPKVGYHGSWIEDGTGYLDSIFCEEAITLLSTKYTTSTAISEMFGGIPIGEFTPIETENNKDLIPTGDMFGDLFWSNFDILGANSTDGVITLDGTTYLAATEPVPVYE